MRTSLLVTLFSVSVFATIAQAVADPAGDVNQAIKAFAAIKSVHVDVTAPMGGGSEDMVEPNKIRYSLSIMQRQIQIVRIGPDSWVNMSGQWRKSSSASRNPIVTQMDLARQAILKQKDIREEYTVSSAGSATVGGVTGLKYHVVDKSDPSRSADVVIGANHLPLQIMFNSPRGGPLTFTYSQYNSVADITPPM